GNLTPERQDEHNDEPSYEWLGELAPHACVHIRSVLTETWSPACVFELWGKCVGSVNYPDTMHLPCQFREDVAFQLCPRNSAHYTMFVQARTRHQEKESTAVGLEQLSCRIRAYPNG